MKSRLTFLAASLLLAGSLHAEPLEVVSSFSILGDVAKQIGGERVHVSTLVGPDADAHAYQLNSADLRKISAAKLILLNGLGLEKADVQKTEQGDNAPFAAPRQPARPCQQQQSGRQHADKRGGERAVWRQKFGGDQISAAPNQRGERGGENGGGAVGHGGFSFVCGVLAWQKLASLRFQIA